MSRSIKFITVITGTALLYFGIHFFLRPNVYVSASSPDGRFELSMSRRRVFPYYQGVDIVAVLIEKSQNKSTRTWVDNRDNWEDAKEYYGSIVWGDNEVLVNPGWQKPFVLKLPRQEKSG